MKILKKILVSTMAIVMLAFCGITLTACGTSIVGKWEVIEVSYEDDGEIVTTKKGEEDFNEGNELFYEFKKDKTVNIYHKSGNSAMEGMKKCTWAKASNEKYIITLETEEASRDMVLTLKDGKLSFTSNTDLTTFVLQKVK